VRSELVVGHYNTHLSIVEKVKLRAIEKNKKSQPIIEAMSDTVKKCTPDEFKSMIIAAVNDAFPLEKAEKYLNHVINLYS